VVTFEQDGEEVGHISAMARVPILAREANLTAREKLIHAAGVLAVAKPHQGSQRHATLAELATQDRERSQADPAADEDRPGHAGGEVTRHREGATERSRDPEALTGAKTR